eukprot:gene7528-biopygen16560
MDVGFCCGVWARGVKSKPGELPHPATTRLATGQPRTGQDSTVQDSTGTWSSVSTHADVGNTVGTLREVRHAKASGFHSQPVTPAQSPMVGDTRQLLTWHEAGSVSVNQPQKALLEQPSAAVSWEHSIAILVGDTVGTLRAKLPQAVVNTVSCNCSTKLIQSAPNLAESRSAFQVHKKSGSSLRFL